VPVQARLTSEFRCAGRPREAERFGTTSHLWEVGSEKVA
jgi:hypothetical protein